MWPTDMIGWSFNHCSSSSLKRELVLEKVSVSEDLAVSENINVLNRKRINVRKYGSRIIR